MVTNHGRQHWFGAPRKDAKRYRYVPNSGHVFAGLYRNYGYYDKVCGKGKFCQGQSVRLHKSFGGGGGLMMYHSPFSPRIC